MNIRQTEVPALMAEGQAFVVESEQAENRCLNGIFLFITQQPFALTCLKW